MPKASPLERGVGPLSLKRAERAGQTRQSVPDHRCRHKVKLAEARLVEPPQNRSGPRSDLLTPTRPSDFAALTADRTAAEPLCSGSEECSLAAARRTARAIAGGGNTSDQRAPGRGAAQAKSSAPASLHAEAALTIGGTWLSKNGHRTSLPKPRRMKKSPKRTRTDADGADQARQTRLGEQHAAFDERPNV